MILVTIFVLAALPGIAQGSGLRDEPLLGDATQLLDGAPWTATDNATTINATVPGDLVTDLQRAGRIGDPLYERNFKALDWDREWQYTLSFDTATDLNPAAGGARWLVLDSVKMGAWIWFNGVYLGAVQDQFLRWRFDVTALLKAPTAGPNVLAVTFAPSNHSLNDQARWTACSGAWDCESPSCCRGLKRARFGPLSARSATSLPSHSRHTPTLCRGTVHVDLQQRGRAYLHEGHRAVSICRRRWRGGAGAPANAHFLQW